jgi:DNA-binding transcriptional ArsR family regulator
MEKLVPTADACCPPSERAKVAAKLAALSHPARLAILARIAGFGTCSCKDVVAGLDLAQSTVSQHLRILVDAGLVSYAADRRRSRYEVDRRAVAELSASVSRFMEGCCRQPGEGA